MDILTIRKQNPWWENRERIKEDPKIKEYMHSRIQWNPRLRKNIDLTKNAIYSIRGPRQVGKTTLVKLMIESLLNQPINPINIIYFACDLLKDNTALADLIDSYYSWVRVQNKERVHIFLDEISSVKDWQSAIKHFIDLNGNQEITLLVTGSHTLDIKESTERLPGRVGEKEHVSTHKILLPMKFAEYVQLRNPELYKHVQELHLHETKARMEQFLSMIHGNLPSSASSLLSILPELDVLLDEYLLTGGIMIAVNEYLTTKRISSQIYEIYLRQMIGDMTRIKREEKTAKLILASILKRICVPLSWNSIRTENDIASPPTVEQYVQILRHMFVLNIFYKMELDGTVKTASDKKVHILNPFIFHALYGWLINPAQDPFQSAEDFILDPKNKSTLIEAVIGDHLNRAAYNIRPTDIFDASDFVYYAKTKKGYEIDYVFKTHDAMVGVDVTYQNTLNAEDFRGIIKLGKGCMVSKKDCQQRGRIAVVPASIFLLYI